jgi:hypothetical protein
MRRKDDIKKIINEKIIVGEEKEEYEVFLNLKK